MILAEPKPRPHDKRTAAASDLDGHLDGGLFELFLFSHNRFRLEARSATDFAFYFQ